MLKVILITLLMTINAYTKVDFQWTGVSGFILSDEQTSIFFDPNITMVSIADWMPWGEVESDPEEVDYWMRKCELKNLKGVFINHSHYDHMLDAPMILKKFGGKLYGSQSTLNYGRGMGIDESRLIKINYNQEYQVGGFSIKPLRAEHPKHLGPLMLSDGKINKPLKTPIHPVHFRLGKTHSFLIKYEDKKILFSAVAKISEPDHLAGIEADTLIVTMAKRGDTTTFVKKRILPTRAKNIIPVHFDNFFKKLSRDKKPHYLPFVDFEEFVSTTKAMLPAKSKLISPSYCQRVNLF